MNAVPARRRSVVSVVVGALAMVGSLAVMGVLVVSDVAAAKEPLEAAPEQVARVDQEQTVTADEPQTEDALVVAGEIEKKPSPRKRPHKKAKVDFGRFEGY